METDGPLTEDEIVSMLTPDTGRLDEQWARQPRNRRRVSKMYADAAAAAARAKNAVKVAEAEASLRVRGKPDRYGVKGKLTEGVVDALVTTSVRVKKAQEEHVQAQHAADVLKGLLSAVDDMRAALENEVKLEARDYFARPRLDPASGAKMKDKIDAAKRKAAFGGGKPSSR